MVSSAAFALSSVSGPVAPVLAAVPDTDSPLLLATGAALCVGLLLVLIRAIAGPTVYDRLLAVNTTGTKAVVIVALLGLINWPAHAYFIDIALVYALINFVTTVAILKFVEYRRLG